MLKLFKNFDESVLPAWQKLYDRGANYNLSPQWCMAWFKQFGKAENLRIITFWENSELKLLAPFHVRKNKLTLIGTKPDMFDEFNVLYDSPEFLGELFKYIVQNNLQVDFRHLSCESEFSKQFIKFIAGNGVKQTSHVDETKAYIEKEFVPTGSFRRDIERCQRNLTKNTGHEYGFEFLAEKNDGFIDDFVKFHTKRWSGGMLEKNAGLIAFLKDTLKNNRSAVLSRLFIKDTNETAAIGIGYLDSNNKYWYSMTTFNDSYSKFSPGKVFLYELINAVFKQGIEHFDLGRGAEHYKSWVADKQDILFTIKTYNNPKLYKIRTLVDKILELVSSI